MNARRIGLCCCLAVLLLFTVAYADDTEKGEGPRGIKTVASQERPVPTGTGWAVIVGINQYSDRQGIGSLKYCESDAQAFYDILTTTCGFPAKNCRLLLGSSSDARKRPTRSNLYNTLTSWLSLAKKNDIVIVYFAGHGIEGDQRSYLLPQDASVTNPELTGLPLGHVKDFLRKSKAERKVLIVDACHSGEGRDLGTMNLNWTDDSKGLVCITSCDIGQKSYEYKEKGHGAFTWFLMRALMGLADSDRDGYIRVSEVNRFVNDRVRRWAAERGIRQSPRFVASVSGDPILARHKVSGRPSTTAASPAGKDPNRLDIVLLKSGKIIECEATEIGNRVFIRRRGGSTPLPMSAVQEIRYGAGKTKAEAKAEREKRVARAKAAAQRKTAPKSKTYLRRKGSIQVEILSAKFYRKGKRAAKIVIGYRVTNIRKDRTDLGKVGIARVMISPDKGKRQDWDAEYGFRFISFDLPYDFPQTGTYTSKPFADRPSSISILLKTYIWRSKKYSTFKFPRVVVTDAEEE